MWPHTPVAVELGPLLGLASLEISHEAKKLGHLYARGCRVMVWLLGFLAVQGYKKDYVTPLQEGPEKTGNLKISGFSARRLET